MHLNSTPQTNFVTINLKKNTSECECLFFGVHIFRGYCFRIFIEKGINLLSASESERERNGKSGKNTVRFGNNQILICV